jgi:predicted Zn-dependent protease
MHNKILLKQFILMLLIFGGIWAAFIYLFDNQGIDAELDILSVEYEEKLGKKIYETYCASYTEVENEIVDSAISLLKERLLSKIPSSEYNYKVRVLESSLVNAFALPGGYIVLNTGLIEISENPEEVAAVLGHEIGHVENKHVIDNIIRELGMGIILAVISGGDPILIGEASKMLASSYFSREQEKEADDFSLDLLEKANTNPRYMASIFRKMKEKSEIKEDKYTQFLSTHPSINNRIRAALEYKIDSTFEEVPIVLDWERVKENLHK